MRSNRIAFLLVVAFGISGCYHATIDTGLTPSGQTVENKWATGWIAGLVPPKTVETASQCPNGVARVETQLSFLNQVANFVTFGIYSPMTITVQCAAARSSSRDARPDGALAVSRTATYEVKANAISEAAARARDTGAPVFIRFE